MNRAFMYGESVFTTMRMVDGVVQDWGYHFERLRKGVEFLYGPFTDGPDWVPLFKNRLETKFQNETGDKVLRLTVYREQARGMLRSSLISFLDLKLHLASSVFDNTRIESRMFKLRTCPAPTRPHWWPSYLKAGNYLETILCQKKYLTAEDDDILFLSPSDTVLESSVANIFIVRHDTLYTAPPGPNVLEGIMRKKVIDAAPDFFSDFIESETTMEQLLKANAVFGTNSIRGLFLVDRIDDYEITYSDEFLDKFMKLKNKVFYEKT